jgi:MoaD family protein
MKVKIRLLKPFSNTIGKSEILLDFNGSTLESLFKVLIERYPKLKEEFYTNKNELTEYLSVFVNDKPISSLRGINTKLKDGDELLFFVPISGG